MFEAIEGVVPTPHVIESALLVGRLIDAQGDRTQDVRMSYAHSPNGGLYSPEDLVRGERLLIRAGLLHERDGWLVPTPELEELRFLDGREARRLVAWCAVASAPPLWISTAVTPGGLAPELIPDEEWETLGQSMSPEEREMFLLALGRRFDQQAATAQGAAGEEAVMSACREALLAGGRDNLVDGVRQVSRVSDQLGYDVVTPTLTGELRRLEVKTTVEGPHIFPVTLSRNEAEVGVRDPSWELVICRWDHESATVQGWCSSRNFAELLPQDVDPRGRWASARVLVAASDLERGIPV